MWLLVNLGMYVIRNVAYDFCQSRTGLCLLWRHPRGSVGSHPSKLTAAIVVRRDLPHLENVPRIQRQARELPFA